MLTMPRFAAHDSAYWATKPASPRTANRPITATGIGHSGSAPCWKPRSSSGFNNAGISGSVAAPTIVAAIATSEAGAAAGKVRRDASEARP